MARAARRDFSVLIEAAYVAQDELEAACKGSLRLMAKLRKAMEQHHGRINGGMHQLNMNSSIQGAGRRVPLAHNLVSWREVHEGGVALVEAMAELQANQAAAIVFALGFRS